MITDSPLAQIGTLKDIDIKDTDIVPLTKISRDLKKAAETMNKEEVRFAVTTYYDMQGLRIKTGNEATDLTKRDIPHETIGFFTDSFGVLENSVKAALDAYSSHNTVGRWMRRQKGIGPVIAAGLLAHIDITKAPTAGAIWSYAGLDPTKKWEKGQKRPWNADLKVICWKLGESFVKVSGNEEAFYGGIYKQRKALETAKNEAGEYAETAKEILASKNFGKDTEARKWYEQGKLPPAHIHARAKRYAVKIFLSHLHEVMYWDHFKQAPPAPYVMVHMGHAHFIEVPNYDDVKLAA